MATKTHVLSCPEESFRKIARRRVSSCLASACHLCGIGRSLARSHDSSMEENRAVRAL